MRQAVHLAQHLFDPASNVLAILAQLHQLAAHGFVLFLAFFELLPQSLRIALGGSPGFFGGLVQLNGAINFLFQRLKIFSRNLRRYLPRFSRTWVPLAFGECFSVEPKYSAVGCGF